MLEMAIPNWEVPPTSEFALTHDRLMKEDNHSASKSRQIGNNCQVRGAVESESPCCYLRRIRRVSGI